MAAGDVYDSVKPRDYIGQNGQPQEAQRLRLAGTGLGVLGFPLRKLDKDGFYVVVKTSPNGTPLATGLTVKITTVDDPNNSAAGLNFVLGVSGAKFVSGTTNLNTLALGTEVTATVTANATAGVVTTTTIAVPKANLNTPVGGDEVLLFVRRNGSNAADTHTGEVLVLNVVVSDT